MNLVSTDWLDQNLNKVKIFDASWHMPTSKRNSKKEYEQKHIKGAIFWDVDEHSDKDSPYPHMMSNSDYWTRMLWSFAVKNDDHIVVSVLDGGMKKWLSENRPIDNETDRDLGKFSNIDKLNPKNKYKIKEKIDLIKNKKQIDENINKNQFQTVDARSRERFEGKVDEPRSGLRKGCIVGSKNLPFKDCINSETNTFKSKDELSKIFIKNNIDITRPIVFTCGSGMTAWVLGMAYSIISGKSAVVYDGSWSEYGKI